MVSYHFSNTAGSSERGGILTLVGGGSWTSQRCLGIWEGRRIRDPSDTQSGLLFFRKEANFLLIMEDLKEMAYFPQQKKKKSVLVRNLYFLMQFPGQKYVWMWTIAEVQHTRKPSGMVPRWPLHVYGVQQVLSTSGSTCVHWASPLRAGLCRKRFFCSGKVSGWKKGIYTKSWWENNSLCVYTSHAGSCASPRGW